MSPSPMRAASRHGRLSRGHRELAIVLRDQFDGNQSALARALDISSAAVNRWIASGRSPDFERMCLLRDRYLIDVDAWRDFGDEAAA